MVDTLFHMSHQFGNQRMFAPEVIRDIGMGAIALGEIIDPLLKFDELFGDENARTLGVGLAYYCTDLSTGFFDENGDVVGNQLYRSGISILSGVYELQGLRRTLRYLQEESKYMIDCPLM